MGVIRLLHFRRSSALTYRVYRCSREACLQLVENKDWAALYENDQLKEQQQSGAAFGMFKELTPPPFRPTAPLTRGLTGDYQPGVRLSLRATIVSAAY
jgi:hypothetical protein